jgi:hypothetical protein
MIKCTLLAAAATAVLCIAAPASAQILGGAGGGSVGGAVGGTVGGVTGGVTGSVGGNVGGNVGLSRGSTIDRVSSA